MAEQQQRRKHCRWRPSSPLSLLPSHHRRAAAALHLHSRQRCCCAALERTLRCCSREARPSCKTEKERKRASSFLSFFCFFNAFRRRQICSSAFTFFLVPSLSLPQKKNMTPSPYDSPRLSAAHPPWPGAFEAPPPTASSTLASPRGAGTARPQPQPQPQLQRRRRAGFHRCPYGARTVPVRCPYGARTRRAGFERCPYILLQRRKGL